MDNYVLTGWMARGITATGGRGEWRVALVR